MAAGGPMAGQSGCSKYEHGIQRLARNLWVKALSIVYTLPEVTSPQTTCDARMLHENAKKKKKRSLGAQNTSCKVMSQCGDTNCLTAVMYLRVT